MSPRPSARTDNPTKSTGRDRKDPHRYAIFDVTARDRARVAPMTARGPDGDLLTAAGKPLPLPVKVAAFATLTEARAAYAALPNPSNFFIHYKES